MSDINDDYWNYDPANGLEAGPHPGLSDAAGWLVLWAAVVLGIVVLAFALLV
jgi:hypothetical protein